MADILFHYEAGPQLKSDVVTSAEGLTVTYCNQGDETGFLECLPDVSAIWHVLEPITADHIANAKNLKLIQKIGVGVNTIDLDAARAAGVAVCNMPGSNAQAVAEMTLLLILSTLRKLPLLDRLCRTGVWKPDEPMRESFGELAGRTVGLVGFGAIPKRLAPMLEAIGGTVVYTSRSDNVPTKYQRVPLNTLLETADVVSLHVPLTDQTNKMIDVEQIARMKPGAILINTARGSLVNEAALFEALQSRHLTAAGLDVFDEEPASRNNPLFSLDQVVVTPHISWLTQETLRRSVDIAIRNTHAAIRGEQLVYQVA